MKKIKIIGAGISGMTLAYYLEKKGFEIEIFEALPKEGGKIFTDNKPHFIVEHGPNAFLASQKLEEISQEIGVRLLRTLPDSQKRFLFLKGKLTRWPLNIFETLGFIFHMLKFQLSSSRIPEKFESVEVWAQKKFGSAFTFKILKTFLQGIYAGDISQMSARYLYQSLFIRNPRGRLKGSVSTEKGMGEWVLQLKNNLIKKGVQFHFENSIQEITPGTCIATSAEEALKLLNINPEFEMLPIVRVTVGLLNPKKKIKGFGILIHPNEKLRALGILSNTCVFAQKAKLYNETWMFGGSKDKEAIRLSDEEIKNLILAEREKVLGVKDSIDEIHIIRWQKALPHTTVKFEEQMQKLNLPTHVWLTGNYLSGIGLTKIIEHNAALSQNIAEEYKEE